MKYFHDLADVREEMKRVFFTKTNSYTLHRPYEVTRVGFEKPDTVVYVARNSEAGRPRLFTDEGKPIELSYCILDDIRSLMDEELTWLENEHIKRKLAAKLEELKQWQNFPIVDEYHKLNIVVPVYKGETEEDLQADFNTPFEKHDLQHLELIESRIKFFKLQEQLVPWAREILDDKTCESYHKLTPKEKAQFHWELEIIEPEKGYYEVDHAWERADEFSVEYPVFDQLWDRDVARNLSLLLRFHVNQFYFISKSTSCMEILIKMLELGWSVERPVYLTNKEHRDWNREGLLIKKAHED